MHDRRRERLEARIKASFEVDLASFGQLVRDVYVEAMGAMVDRPGSLPPLCWEDVAKFHLVVEEEGRVTSLWKPAPVGGSVWSRMVRCGRWQPVRHVTLHGGQTGYDGSGGMVTITGGQSGATGNGGAITLHGGQADYGDSGGTALVGSRGPEPPRVAFPLDPEHILLVAGWDRLKGPTSEDDPPPYRWAVASTTWSGRALAAITTARTDHDSPVSVGLAEIDYAQRDTGPLHGADDLWDAALSRGSWRRPRRGDGWVVLPDVPWNVLVAWVRATAPKPIF